MEFSSLDLMFVTIVVVLMSLSFVGLLYIVIDDTSKFKSKQKYEESKNNDKKKK